MTGRASPKYGVVSGAVYILAEEGHDAAAIRARLAPVHGLSTVYRAIARAQASGVLPRPVKKHPSLLVIKLPGRAGKRLTARADAEGISPSELAKIILHRASRSIDTMELHL